MDRQGKEFRRFNSTGSSPSGDVFEPTVNNNAKQRGTLIEWLNSTLPGLNLPVNASDEELRAILIDGSILCRVLNKLRPGSVVESVTPNRSLEARSENVKKFLTAMDEIGLPRFQLSDLERGSMKIVLECLLTLKAHYMPSIGGGSTPSPTNRPAGDLRWKTLADHIGSGDASPTGELSPRTYASIVAGGDEKRKTGSDSKFQRALRSPVMAEPSAALIHHVGHKFHEVFQLKQGGYADLPASKLSEMMKSNSLDLAPTQSLLSVVNGILDESIDRKNAEIPHRVACLLRKVVQEIERRISTQAEHLRTQNNLFRAREEKYQSRIRVLEALATGTNEEAEVAMNQLQQAKNEKTKVDENEKMKVDEKEKTKVDEKEKTKVDEKEKTKVDEKRKSEEQDLERMVKEKEIMVKEKENMVKERENMMKERENMMKGKENYDNEISSLKQELEMARKAQDQWSSQMEKDARKTQQELEERLKEVLNHLMDSKNKVKELEAYTESESQGWNKKAQMYQILTEFQLGVLRELRYSSQSVRQEILQTQKSYSEEFDRLGNIRVYCRIRPFLPGQSGKESIIEYIGENGELVVSNPSKQGKEGRRSFKFNKVYGPEATQAGVFADTQPLIQSVLDGYNVCIFAYGQTGSGKTYTMSGPDKGSKEEWGVNYRALNDLFNISRTRQGTYRYEVGVQMVEIYNEQVRDLLSTDPQKRLGILATSQPNGLAVPDASMLPVNSPSDVLDLMETGFKNRARGSTAMNERSSRSHSVVTVHVQGSDLKTGGSIRGSLHLVDLAGSERVDRSEATGDRLKEAQHINKSLSALGDVIFSLSQKNAHVPYRNSKLTQVLQSSLGGQAKTLMFVQLNPDVASFSESLSTLKFAERVSGVELGAAKSSKDGRDVRELMEQVASLKDTIAKKDEEIERLQLMKDLKNVYQGGGVNGEKRVTPPSSLRYGSPSSPTTLSRNSVGSASQRSIKTAKGSVAQLNIERAAASASDHDSSESSDNKHSPVSSQTESSLGQNFSADHHAELGSFGDAENDHERLSDVSDSALSVGTDTDASVESNQFHEGSKLSDHADKPKPSARLPRTPLRSPKDPLKVSPVSSLRKSSSGGNLASKAGKGRRS